jgi:D-xylulose reductase
MSHFHCMTKTQPSQVTDLNLPPNTSCVLLKKRTVSVRDEPLPILQPDGVLVRTIATGGFGGRDQVALYSRFGDEPLTPARYLWLRHARLPRGGCWWTTNNRADGDGT